MLSLMACLHFLFLHCALVRCFMNSADFFSAQLHKKDTVVTSCASLERYFSIETTENFLANEQASVDLTMAVQKLLVFNYRIILSGQEGLYLRVGLL